MSIAYFGVDVPFIEGICAEPKWLNGYQSYQVSVFLYVSMAIFLSLSFNKY